MVSCRFSVKGCFAPPFNLSPLPLLSRPGGRREAGGSRAGSGAAKAQHPRGKGKRAQLPAPPATARAQGSPAGDARLAVLVRGAGADGGSSVKAPRRDELVSDHSSVSN